MMVVPATAEHVEQVSRWLVARGLRPYPPELLVGHGFAVDGLAACWLYETGTPLLLLEHLVANPEAEPDERSAAVDAVVAAAMARAAELGGRVVYATTRLPAVLERARSHGFEVVRDGAWMIAAEVGRKEENHE